MEVNQEVSGMIDDLVRESIGSVLRHEREKQGMSCREVADALRIMPHQVEAIESEDFSGFKADVFIKAYIKNYANLLKVDGEPLLSIYDEQFKVKEVASSKPRLSPIHVPCKKRYLGVAAVIAVIVLLWLMNAGGDEAESGAVGEPEQGVDLGVKQDDATLTDASVAVEIDEVSLAADELNKKAELSAEQMASQPEPTPVINELKLSFSSDCWVEVRDADGKTLLADLKGASDQVTLAGKAPFEVLLGYAPAVTMSFNGDAVAITTGARSQSAKLSVGG